MNIVGPLEGNQDVVECRATFADMKAARRWFTIVTDDPTVKWFEENTVA